MVLVIDLINKRIRGYATAKQIREKGFIEGSINSENRPN